MSTQYKLGDLVWAKMKGFCHWPAQVARPIAAMGHQPAGTQCVCFFGSKDFAWIENDKIAPYEENKKVFETKSKSLSFKKALSDINAFAIKGGTLETEKFVEEDENESKAEEEVELNKDEAAAEEEEEDEIVEEEDEIEIEKRPKPKPKPRKSIASKRTSRKSSVTENGTASPAKKRKTTERIEKQKDDEADEPSYSVFGFIGLGVMGSHIVNNLIKKKYKVNIWNRTASKAEEIEKFANVSNEGLVTRMERVCDLVHNSDIIFICVSDANAVYEVIYANHGLLHELQSFHNKGIVVMTNVPDEKSTSFSNEITSRGGRYLEAQLQGSPDDASKGNLILLTAGNEKLFQDCKTVFKTIGKTAFYLGGTVGSACKMNVVLQMMKGITLVGFAEAMSLADRCAINLKDLAEIFSRSNLESPYLVDNANYVADRNTGVVDDAFKYIQKDFRMALQLADTLKQPLLMTSTANEAIIRKNFW